MLVVCAAHAPAASLARGLVGAVHAGVPLALHRPLRHGRLQLSQLSRGQLDLEGPHILLQAHDALGACATGGGGGGGSSSSRGAASSSEAPKHHHSSITHPRPGASRESHPPLQARGLAQGL